MKIRLIYPVWERIYYQTKYILPPLGVITMAATIPEEHDVKLTDENVETIDFDEDVDLVMISTMLLAQAKRGWEVADEFRKRGKTVILGGLSVTTLPELAAEHADAIVIGEAEGVVPQLLEDFAAGKLKRVYQRPAYVKGVNMAPPRRELLNKPLYNYRGVEMLDLIETSRGCRFGCYPCQVPFVSGTKHRTKAIDRVIEEMASIPNDRLFIVDNALEQDEQHQKELYKAMIDAKLGKKWVAHPISVTDEILDLAAQSGCWYVYHAIHKPSDLMRERIKMHHAHGIGVEGTIMVGLDNHNKDIFKELTDFLLECELDLAEFTVLTPLPGTPVFDKFKSEGRLLHTDWSKYNAEQVVFKPAQMTPDELQEGYIYMWDEFYKAIPERHRMWRLFKRLYKRHDWAPVTSPAKGEARYTAKGAPGGRLWGGVVQGNRDLTEVKRARSQNLDNK